MNNIVLFGKKGIDKSILINSIQSFVSGEPFEDTGFWKHNVETEHGLTYARIFLNHSHSEGFIKPPEDADRLDNAGELLTLINCWGLPELGDPFDPALLTKVVSDGTTGCGRAPCLLQCAITSFRGVLVLEYGTPGAKKRGKASGKSFTDFEDNQLILALEDTFGTSIWLSMVVVIIAVQPITQPSVDKFLKRLRQKHQRFNALHQLVNERTIVVEMSHCNLATGFPCQRIEKLLQMIRTIPTFSNADFVRMETFLSRRTSVRIAACALSKSARKTVWSIRLSSALKEKSPSQKSIDSCFAKVYAALENCVEPALRDFELAMAKYCESFQPIPCRPELPWVAQIAKLKCVQHVAKHVYPKETLVVLVDFLNFLESLACKMDILSCEPKLNPSAICERVRFYDQ